MRVLAFEDGADIALLLGQSGVEFSNITFEQRWTTENAVSIIQNFKPDVLLLDHYIPPICGLDVLRAINEAVLHNETHRPRTIVGMSSMAVANQKMLEEGADFGIIKAMVGTLPFWPRNHSS